MRYRLASNGFVVRVADGATIPPDPENADRQRYEAWLSEGNEPLAEPPPPFDPIAFIQEYLEGVARSMGYSSAASCASYVNSTVETWAAEARAFVAHRDAVWLLVFERKDDPWPASAEEVLALLPAWVPPGA